MEPAEETGRAAAAEEPEAGRPKRSRKPANKADAPSPKGGEPPKKRTRKAKKAEPEPEELAAADDGAGGAGQEASAAAEVAPAPKKKKAAAKKKVADPEEGGDAPPEEEKATPKKKASKKKPAKDPNSPAELARQAMRERVFKELDAAELIAKEELAAGVDARQAARHIVKVYVDLAKSGVVHQGHPPRPLATRKTRMPTAGKRVRFYPRAQVFETYSAAEYDRAPGGLEEEGLVEEEPVPVPLISGAQPGSRVFLVVWNGAGADWGRGNAWDAGLSRLPVAGGDAVTA
ncbi:hypothetical protein DFJ74DRAFT_773063 [Hyaloraphidium curvatum]|nr:hypothetical protein DFJ74DRAFT_773063 [Hyaloraphidium curvatum]